MFILYIKYTYKFVCNIHVNFILISFLNFLSAWSQVYSLEKIFVVL